ncbi:MAG: type 1 glutamine amidotransferase [Pseudomonadota bacterium]
MKIGILLTGHAIPEIQEREGDYDRIFAYLLRDRGFTFQGFNVVDGEFPNGPDDAGGWLITGSKHGAYEDHPWIPPLEQFIRDVHATGKPMIGVCFGHQIIAQALGGTVEKFSGGWSVGLQEYELEGETKQLRAWHQDQVIKPPQGAEIIGSSDFCANAAMLIDGHTLTIQPHPEFTTYALELLIKHRGPGVVPEELLQRAASTAENAGDSEAFGRRMADFFEAKA